MRLEAIERPRGLMLKLAYWYSRRQFGKVIAPLKVLYAGSPGIMRRSLALAQAVENFHNFLGVPLGLESDGLCVLAEHRRADGRRAMLGPR